MAELKLHLDGKAFTRWVSARVTRSMQQLAGDFELVVGGAWVEGGLRPSSAAGKTCEIHIAGVRVQTGIIDSAPANFDATSHGLRLEGRDRTSDLVDCSAPAVQWIGRTLADVARDLCKPFDIKVIDRAGLKTPFKTYKPHDGDSIFAALDQGARYRGVLLLSDVEGNLIIDRVGSVTAADTLELGKNIISGSGGRDLRECFSAYTVKGQKRGSDPAATAQVTATITDRQLITRHRPLTLVCDGPVTAGAARTRAKWEASVRAGRAQAITYKVKGWQQSTGALWEPNQKVQVIDPYNDINEKRLITDVTYSLDDQSGEVAEITVMPPAAFAKLAEPEPEKEDDYDGL